MKNFLKKKIDKKILFIDFNFDTRMLSGSSVMSLVDGSFNKVHKTFVFWFNKSTELSDLLRTLGLTVVIAPTVKFKLLRYLVYNIHTFYIYKSYDLRSIYCNNILSSRTVSWRIFSFKKIPTYCHVRNIPLPKISKIYLNGVNLFLCVSKSVEQELKKIHISNTKVVYDGFPATNKINTESKKVIRIGMMARVCMQKGSDIFRDVALAFEKDNSFEFIYAGGDKGDFRQAFSNRQISFPKNLKVLGYLSENSISKFWSNIDWLICPHTSFEAFGRVQCEGCLNGKLVMTSGIGGPAEFIIHNQTGVIIQPNKQDICSKIRHYSQNLLLVNNIIREGRNSIREKFSSRKYSELVLNIVK